MLLRRVDRLREVRQELAVLRLHDLLAAADEERDRLARDLVRVAEGAVGGERLEQELRVLDEEVVRLGVGRVVAEHVDARLLELGHCWSIAVVM